MEDLLKNHFEVVYKEYKDYVQFAESIAPKIAKEREEFTKFMSENKEDTDTVVNKLLELNFKPSLYQADLQRLQMRLIYVAEAFDSVIEIPQEIKNELKTLKVKQLFKVEGSEAIELEPELIKNIEENFKSSEFQKIAKILENIE